MTRFRAQSPVAVATNILLGALFIMLTATLLVDSSPARAQVKVQGGLLYFGEELVEFEELTNTISEFCHVNIVLSDNVKGKSKVYIFTPDGMAQDEAWETYIYALSLMDATFTKTGEYTRMASSADMPQLPNSVYVQDLPKWDKETPHVVFIYKLKHIEPEEAIKVLDKLRSKTGKLFAFQDKLIFIEYQNILPRLLEILGAIDIGEGSAHIYYWTAKYSPIEDIVSIIESLFMPGGKDKGAAIGLDAIITDERSNGMIIVGTEEAAERVLSFVPRLDIPLTRKMDMEVVFLKFATAEEVVQTLQGIVQGQSRGSQKTGQRQFGDDLEVDISADKQTNSIILVGPPRGIRSLKAVIDKLDRFPRQIFLEVVIMEVTITDDSALGIATVGAKNVAGDSTVIGGVNYGSLNAMSLNPSALMGFAMGIQGPAVEGTGDDFNVGTDLPSFGAVLRALETTGNVNIVANPYLMGMDAEESEIIVGSNVPFVTGTSMDNYNQPVLSIQRQDVALTVKLKPAVNELGAVKLQIDIQVEDLTSISETMGPTTTKRAIKTTVMTQSGSRVALGGLLKDKQIDDDEKVPFLGDIPIIGRIFRSSKSSKEKTNLMAVITPHIIDSQDDLQRIFARKLKERAKYIRQMYGKENQDYDVVQSYHDRVGVVEMIRKLVERQKSAQDAAGEEEYILITPEDAATERAEPTVDEGDMIFVPRSDPPPPPQPEATPVPPDNEP